MSSDKQRIRRTVTSAMLLAAALMISYAETFIPPIAPLPGFKPGLANLAVMAAFMISPAAAAWVSAGRVLIFALLFGTPVSLLMSASGALLSYFLLFFICKAKIGAFSFIGVSVLSALCHNAGQLLAASVLVGNAAVFSYAPVLAVTSLVCGAFSGIIMNHAAPVIVKYTKAADPGKTLF